MLRLRSLMATVGAKQPRPKAYVRTRRPAEEFMLRIRLDRAGQVAARMVPSASGFGCGAVVGLITDTELMTPG